MASIRFSGQPFRQRIVDQGIELGLVAHHAGHDVAEERGFGRQIFVAFDLAAEPVALELGKDVVDPGAADVHLVQRLHRGEPRRAAPVGFLVRTPLAAGLFLLSLPSSGPASRRLIRSIANAARAASPPLLSSLARARAHACASVLTVMMPLPSGIRRATARSISAREDSDRDDLEMNGVAPDHAAERDRGVVGLAAALGGVERDRNRGRNFQRAGHGDDVVLDAGGLQLGDRAFQQRVLDVVVEACLDDQRARA